MYTHCFSKVNFELILIEEREHGRTELVMIGLSEEYNYIAFLQHFPSLKILSVVRSHKCWLSGKKGPGAIASGAPPSPATPLG